MLFSSLLFLWLFLPAVVLLTWFSPRRWRNPLLLLASLLFYAWGGVGYTTILLLSILLNYLLGRAIGSYPASAKGWLALGVVLNLASLAVFKYANWVALNVNGLLELTAIPPVDLPPIALPIGISFYTFQAISYLVDVYRGTVTSQRSIFKLGLYISLFPQLIAGPIVRYKDLCDQIDDRRLRGEQLASGLQRFIIGLGKKVLIANECALVADELFALQAASLDTSAAWLGIVAYSLQIYFDFSGYSDMAIGIGRMLGFELPENFNFPYISRSIREFWHRWHISLSTWFRDYLYFPLGGSYGSRLATYRNLIIVFLLTGLWHGAAWNFLLWGAWHGTFLILERQRWWPVLPAALGLVYTLVVVLFGWVLFRVEYLQQAGYFYAALLGMHQATAPIDLAYYLNPRLVLTLVVGCLFSLPPEVYLPPRLRWNTELGGSVQLLGLVGLLLLCTMELVNSSYNPFIYFRF